LIKAYSEKRTSQTLLCECEKYFATNHFEVLSCSVADTVIKTLEKLRWTRTFIDNKKYSECRQRKW